MGLSAEGGASQLLLRPYYLPSSHPRCVLSDGPSLVGNTTENWHSSLWGVFPSADIFDLEPTLASSLSHSPWAVSHSTHCSTPHAFVHSDEAANPLVLAAQKDGCTCRVFYAHECFACICVCTLHMCLERKGCWIPWNQSY